MTASVTLPGLDVSRETEAGLAAFAALVRQWSPRINLVSPASLLELETRHITDSAQLLRHAPAGWTRWADLGSGGGFPGLVIAILAKEARPGAEVILVESDQRKAVFLRTVIRELALSATVLTARAETAPPLAADVLSARALAPLRQLLPLAQRHLAPGGRALFPKGRRAEEEIAETRRHWHFDLIVHPSLTDPDARVLQIERIAHA